MGPRFPVGLQIGAQEVVVEEGVGALVGQMRADDRLEEAGVLPLQEQVHLMAGELRVAGALFLRAQRGPAHQPLEAGQLRVRIQCPQQTEDRPQRFVGFPPAVPEVVEPQRLAADQSARFPDLGDPLRRLRRLGQAQILGGDGGSASRQRLPGGFGLVLDLHLDDGAISERGGRQPDPALGIGHQVEPGQGTPRQEIQLGARRQRWRGLFLARQALGELHRPGHVAHRGRRCVTFGHRQGHRVGRALVPGVQQQSRAGQAISGVLPGIPSVEDVAGFVADGPTGRVEVGQVVGDPGTGSPACEPSEAGEQPRVGHEVARDHMDAGGPVPVQDPDLGIAPRGDRHRGQVDRRVGPQLQGPVPARQPSGHGNPVGDAQGAERFAGIAQPQRIVAGRQTGDLQLVAHGSDGRAPVGGEGPPAQFQQGPGVRCVPREPRDPHDLTHPGMDLAGAGAIGGLQRPGTMEFAFAGHLDPGELLEPAEFDAALGIGPQGDLLGGGETPPVEDESEHLIGHRFAVSTAHLDPMVFAVPLQEGVTDVGRPFQAVDLPGAGRAQLAFLTPAQWLDPPAQGGRDPCQPIGDPEGPGEQSGWLEVRGPEIDGGRATDAVVGDRGERQAWLREQFGRGRMVADAQRGPDRQHRVGSGHALLRVEVEPGLQGVGLGVMLEFGQRGQTTLGIGENDGSAAGGGRERDLDPAIPGVGLPPASVQPRRGVGDHPRVFVEHPEQIPARPRRLQQAVSSSTDQRTRGTPPADDFDDPSPALALQLGKAEPARGAQER